MAEDTVSQIIVNSLYNAGVRVVFGVPGAKIEYAFPFARTLYQTQAEPHG